MSNPFAQPASATGLNWEDLKGSLLVIEPHGIEQGIQTSFGSKDAVRADVHVLDGIQAGTTYGDSLIFPGVLISQLKPSVGQKVPGRLGQGVGKPGQKPPWKLEETTDEDMQRCMEWLNQQQQGQFSPTGAGEQVNTSTGEVTPAAQQAAPQQAAQAQPAAAPANGPTVDANQVKALISAGMQDSQINQATGADLAVIAAIRNTM